MKAEPDDYSPRYVEVPHRRRGVRTGRRNLVWGLALLFAALLVLAMAVLFGGPRAVLWPIVSLMTFTSLWVLARLRLFHQRNGVFFALSLVALLGSVLAFGERGFTRLAGSLPSGPQPYVSTSDSGSGITAQAEMPLLTEALHLQPPDPSEGSSVKILQNTQVAIGRDTYRVQAGETFALDGAKDGSVTFLAGEFHVKIPQTEVQILGPQRNLTGPKTAKNAARTSPRATEKEPDRDPAEVEIERRARVEAARRFPALASPKSPENQEFVTAYNQLKERHSAMLDDPEWPIRLAESLAKQSNWEEAADATNGSAPDDEVVGRGAPPAPPSEDGVVGRGNSLPSPVAKNIPPREIPPHEPPAREPAPRDDGAPPPPPTPR